MTKRPLSPAGEAVANANPVKVQMYVMEVIKACARRNTDELRDLWDELKPMHDESIAVWKVLKRQHQTEFHMFEEAIK